MTMTKTRIKMKIDPTQFVSSKTIKRNGRQVRD